MRALARYTNATPTNALLATASAACLVLLPHTVQAQAPATSDQATNGQAVEEVVVEAQRRSENLQRVPITVSTVSMADAQAVGAVDSTMLASAVPGLTISENAEAFLPFIRGIGTTAVGPGLGKL